MSSKISFSVDSLLAKTESKEEGKTTEAVVKFPLPHTALLYPWLFSSAVLAQHHRKLP